MTGVWRSIVLCGRTGVLHVHTELGVNPDPWQAVRPEPHIMHILTTGLGKRMCINASSQNQLHIKTPLSENLQSRTETPFI